MADDRKQAGSRVIISSRSKGHSGKNTYFSETKGPNFIIPNSKYYNKGQKCEDHANPTTNPVHQHEFNNASPFNPVQHKCERCRRVFSLIPATIKFSETTMKCTPDWVYNHCVNYDKEASSTLKWVLRKMIFAIRAIEVIFFPINFTPGFRTDTASIEEGAATFHTIKLVLLMDLHDAQTMPTEQTSRERLSAKIAIAESQGYRWIIVDAYEMEHAFRETKQITIPSQNDSIHQFVRALVSCGCLINQSAPTINRDAYAAWVTNQVTMVCKELTNKLNMMSVNDPLFLQYNSKKLTDYMRTFTPHPDYKARIGWYLWNYTAQNSGPVNGFQSFD